MRQRRGRWIVLGVVSVVWLSGSHRAWAEEQRALQTPLTDMPERFQTSSEEEGPLLGLWRAVTGTAPASPTVNLRVAAPDKKARPHPLTLREYLNQDIAPTGSEPSAPAETPPAPIPPDEHAGSAGTLLQYGF